MLELLHQVPLFSWLPEEGAETLSNCFDLCVEELNAGETRATEGRIGCLLRGGADFRTDNDTRTLAPGDVFALDRDRNPLSGVLTAGKGCAVAWFRRDLVLHVCYRACWFHARLIQEIDRKLNECK